MTIHESELTEFDTKEVFVDLDATQPCAVGDTEPLVPFTTSGRIGFQRLPEVIVLPPLPDEMTRLAERFWRERRDDVWARIMRRIGL